MENRKKVLGVLIDDISLSEALSRIGSWLGDGNERLPKIIVTPGPEFLLTAQKDEEFRKILNGADLALPDGVGLRLAGIKNTVAGVDFMQALCGEATKNSWTVGLFGGREGVAYKAGEKLQEMFPGLIIKFAVDGQKMDKILRYYDSDGDIDKAFDSLGRLPDVDLLFVALGHPKQEKFLWQFKNTKFSQGGNSARSAQFKAGMGVGGSFDFLAGVLPRCPVVLRKLGLEWLWRGVTKPGHWRRIWRAVVEFPIMLLWNRG